MTLSDLSSQVSNEFRCSETTYVKTHIGLDETNITEIDVNFVMNVMRQTQVLQAQTLPMIKNVIQNIRNGE